MLYVWTLQSAYMRHLRQWGPPPLKGTFRTWRYNPKVFVFGPFSFDKGISASRGFLGSLKSDATSQFSSNNSLVLPLDVHLFASFKLASLNSHFPRRWKGEGKPIAWSSRSPDLTLLYLYASVALWKSQRVNHCSWRYIEHVTARLAKRGLYARREEE
jgi:hypothetical protein